MVPCGNGGGNTVSERRVSRAPLICLKGGYPRLLVTACKLGWGKSQWVAVAGGGLGWDDLGRPEKVGTFERTNKTIQRGCGEKIQCPLRGESSRTQSNEIKLFLGPPVVARP